MIRPGGTDAPLPRVRRSARAVWELMSLWWCAGMLGIVLGALLLTLLQTRELREQRDARLEVMLQSLRERVELDLTLGEGFSTAARAQAMLESLLAAHPTLLAAELFDPGEITVFSTDRGAIGDAVPAQWRDEAWRAAPTRARWVVRGKDADTIGLPVLGPFGEVAGNLCVTVSPMPAPAWERAAIWTGLTLLAFTVLSALAGRWLLGTLSGQRDSQPLQAALERLNNAEIRHERAYAELTQSAETT